MFGSLLGGCIIPAPVHEGEVEPPIVIINKDKAEPAHLKEVTVNRAEPITAFSIGSAVVQSNVTNALRYYWYYDYDATVNVPDVFGVCGSASTCRLSVCKLPQSGSDAHRLLIVVADSTLPEAAADPYGFPPGTAWDSLEWKLKLAGVCPGQ